MRTKSRSAVLGFVGLAILLLLWRPDAGAADPIALGAPAPVPQAVTPVAAAAGERKAAPSEAPLQFAKSRDFETVFAELLQALVPPGSQPPDTAEGVAAARRQMDRVRELVAEIVTCFPDAGQRGFHRLATLAAPWQEAAVRREAQAAGMVVDFWLQRTHDQPARRPERIRHGPKSLHRNDGSRPSCREASPGSATNDHRSGRTGKNARDASFAHSCD
jgi:hypothetical protein